MCSFLRSKEKTFILENFPNYCFFTLRDLLFFFSFIPADLTSALELGGFQFDSIQFCQVFQSRSNLSLTWSWILAKWLTIRTYKGGRSLWRKPSVLWTLTSISGSVTCATTCPSHVLPTWGVMSSVSTISCTVTSSGTNIACPKAPQLFAAPFVVRVNKSWNLICLPFC